MMLARAGVSSGGGTNGGGEIPRSADGAVAVRATPRPGLNWSQELLLTWYFYPHHASAPGPSAGRHVCFRP